jgi:hypothetical protein
MDAAKLDHYRRAVAELQGAAEALSQDFVDWDAAHAEYLNVKERCQKARLALFDSGDPASFRTKDS